MFPRELPVMAAQAPRAFSTATRAALSLTNTQLSVFKKPKFCFIALTSLKAFTPEKGFLKVREMGLSQC